MIKDTFLTKKYESCALCPRACGINRLRGEVGFCGATAKLAAGRAMLHMWEEPPISGTHGSGAVFFVHCTLGCVYCQNRHISARETQGATISCSGLAEVFLKLQQQGAHNINLVTAAHYAPHLISSIAKARAAGLCVPVILNTGGYEAAETLDLLSGSIDIYLPDFKYYSSYYSQLYSGVADYFEVADQAIDVMVAQTGAPQFEKSGLMRRGTVIRHLMLPGLLGDTKQVLRHIAARWGDHVLVSLMRQYTPVSMESYPELNRTVSDAEYKEALSYFQFLGLSGFSQDAQAISQSFIPSFNGQGI